jgi:hypothetical protein
MRPDYRLTMTSDEWIRWHAGLAIPEDAPGRMSVDECLVAPDASADDLDAAVNDLLQAMSALNLELMVMCPQRAAR